MKFSLLIPVLFGVVMLALLPVAHGQARNSTVQQFTQNGVTMQFNYLPTNPIINNYTTLMFSVINSTDGKPVENYIAYVTIGNVVGFTGGSGYYKFSNIAVTNGRFSVNYEFPNDGLFPVFFRADYPTSAYGPDSPIAIGEFKVVVPAPAVLPSDNTMIYVIIGVAVAVGGAVAAIMTKRKPSNR